MIPRIEIKTSLNKYYFFLSSGVFQFSLDTRLPILIILHGQVRKKSSLHLRCNTRGIRTGPHVLLLKRLLSPSSQGFGRHNCRVHLYSRSYYNWRIHESSKPWHVLKSEDCCFISREYDSSSSGLLFPLENNCCSDANPSPTCVWNDLHLAGKPVLVGFEKKIR